MVRAIRNGEIIAESDDTIVVEGNLYFPIESVRAEFLEPSDHHTTCGWKAKTSYQTLVVDGRQNTNAAWHYPNPLPAAKNITGRVAFWKGVTIDTAPTVVLIDAHGAEQDRIIGVASRARLEKMIALAEFAPRDAG